MLIHRKEVRSVQMSISVTSNTKQKVKNIAEENDCSLSDVVNSALREYFEKYKI